MDFSYYIITTIIRVNTAFINEEIERKRKLKKAKCWGSRKEINEDEKVIIRKEEERKIR